MDNFLKTFFETIDIQNLHFSKNEIISIWTDTSVKEKILTKVNKIHISSIILVKDQEGLIASSIDSADKMSDRIFVYDTGSTDSTVEIVRKLKKENSKIVLDFLEWEDDFSKMRNLAAELSTSEWVIFIDSDEQILSSLRLNDLKMTLAFLEYLEPKYDLCLCLKATEDDSVIINWTERLYKNSGAIKYFGVVHEEPRSNNLLKIKTAITIFNHGHSEELIHKFDKEKKYYTLLQQNINLEPQYIKWYALLPFNYSIKHDKDYPEILEKIYNNLEQYNCDSNTFFEETLIINYIRSLIYKENISQAINILEKMKIRYPENTTFLYYYYILKNLEIVVQAKQLLNLFKQDVRILKQNHSKLEWEEYQSLTILEDILVKLLLKNEEYILAKQILTTIGTSGIANKLMSKELDFITIL
ncbi:glycosyltransferase [Streptococcus suis]|uniref:glycosyltransferase n=1 Tax=Streptococcus suis TaxID=1307 RepID=UPI0005CCCC3B|nr:glycosyltransferase [Streptococcus suis]MDW8709787.1 glycosyltransferase [Streptococcus suis]NQG42463.1 glycosyltransferase [Streptococcus suis]CYV65672.1 glycosyltransferase group 2 family protein [Streptococcus suis]HEL2220752.1 glycosyltransferase [Streptococcus suis]